MVHDTLLFGAAVCLVVGIPASTFPGRGVSRGAAEPAGPARGVPLPNMSLLSTLRMYRRRTPKLSEPTDIYANRVKLLDGGELDLASLRGKPTLIVNTASKCGYTPQYEGLQALYECYSGRGLQMLGSPSADFADQEYEEADEIAAFCRDNYGVTFPLTERTSVRADPSPLWNEISQQPGSGPPMWNFTKYLIGADGELIARFPTKVPPDDPKIAAAIESALAD
jgi:glutathione peroxidase